MSGWLFYCKSDHGNTRPSVIFLALRGRYENESNAKLVFLSDLPAFYRSHSLRAGFFEISKLLTRKQLAYRPEERGAKNGRCKGDPVAACVDSGSDLVAAQLIVGGSIRRGA